MALVLSVNALPRVGLPVSGCFSGNGFVRQYASSCWPARLGVFVVIVLSVNTLPRVDLPVSGCFSGNGLVSQYTSSC